MGATVEYRMANMKDVDTLVEMRWDFQMEFATELTTESKAEFNDVCRKFYQDAFQNSNWTFLVAIINTDIVAHIALYVVGNIPTPTRLMNQWGYITNVYTKKEYRKLGIGSELTKNTISAAKKLKLETIIVWPSDESVGFYEKFGFTSRNDIMELSLE